MTAGEEGCVEVLSLWMFEVELPESFGQRVDSLQ